jgi:hypothetical protein
MKAKENTHAFQEPVRTAGEFRNEADNLGVGQSMNWRTIAGVSLMFAALLFGSILVFQTFDRTSNSASDTIRPFIITMGPVWGVAIAAAAVLLRKPRT